MAGHGRLRSRQLDCWDVQPSAWGKLLQSVSVHVSVHVKELSQGQQLRLYLVRLVPLRRGSLLSAAVCSV